MPSRPARFVLCTFALPILIALAACGPDLPADVEVALDGVSGPIDYNLHVKPILSDRCYKCHGPDNNARKANLRLDTEEGARAALENSERVHAVVPGDIGASEVVYRLVSDEPDYRMPPPDANLDLTPQEVATIISWIDQGAEFKRHWSLITPERPTPPKTSTPDWDSNPVDAFVTAKFLEYDIEPSPRADPETLIRRASFDLRGLPPSVEEIDEFLADTEAGAFGRLVDRLLESPSFGERMASDWLDVSRYADTHGYQDDGIRNVWPYRDWVIRAYNDNKPYDEFIVEQLAGDLLPDPTRDQLLATAFNRNHLQSQEGGIVSEEYRVEYVADRTNTVGKGLLGITMECARCHDHKYDPISQKDYFEMYSFFNNNNEVGQITYSGEASPVVTVVSEEAEAELNELRSRIEAIVGDLDYRNTKYSEPFETWLSAAQVAAGGSIKAPAPTAHYPLDEAVDGKIRNLRDRSKDGSIVGDPDLRPDLVEGKFGKAVLLNADNTPHAPGGVAHFERNDPFTISAWFQLLSDSVRGPLMGKAGGLYNGRRGYMSVLAPDHTVRFSINHVWPANTIEIQTSEKLLTGVWHHIALTYDGSSRASGLAIYVDGKKSDSKVLTDNLTQSILHDRKGTNWGDAGTLRLGRYGDFKLDSTRVDDLKAFDVQLSAIEVAALSDPEVIDRALNSELSDEQRNDLREYYVYRVDPAYKASLKTATELRGEENRIMTEQDQVMILQELPEPRATHILDRGAYDAPTERVGPGVPEEILPLDLDENANRLDLAQWIVDQKNPLTARVAANRLWQSIFGRGLVSTPDDFGNQGNAPTHPLLLDWLAVEFVESGWDVKHLLKQIVTSETYKQSSAATEAAISRDPYNEMLARGPSYRLSAEMIRDNALAASGLLVRTIGGPSVMPYQPPGLWKEQATRNATEYVAGTGDDLYRRSLYTFWKRTTPPPSMINFDASERNLCEVTRQKTNTPLQALVLLNDPQYVEASRGLAERMLKSGSDLASRIAYGYRSMIGRHPDETESGLLRALFESEVVKFRAGESDPTGLLTAGEREADPAIDRAELASMTLVANTIMNFDEAIYKR